MYLLMHYVIWMNDIAETSTIHDGSGFMKAISDSYEVSVRLSKAEYYACLIEAAHLHELGVLEDADISGILRLLIRKVTGPYLNPINGRRFSEACRMFRVR